MSEPRVWLRRVATRDFRNLEKIDLGADADYVLPIPGGSVRIPKPREA